MRFVWKGKFKSMEQLSKGNLPPDAVRFKEPETPAKLNLAACLFIMPALAAAVIAAVAKRLIFGTELMDNSFNIVGILLAFLTVLPHEFLHGIAFPQKAEVQVWYSLKNMMAFVFSTYPVSKTRFIFISLLPNVVFGLIPLIIWIVLPPVYSEASDILYGFAATNLLMGAGDYLNVYNAARQMPKGSMTQLSGFHSYWYLPGK